MTFVYICIPVHDEEQTIGPLLWKIRRVMAEYGRDYHIVVADDASTDATPEILASYVGVMPLTVIRCAERRGYGPTLERALRKAASLSRYPKRDTAVTLQGDFTDDPALIPELARHIEGGADIVGNAARSHLKGAHWSQRLARSAFERFAGRRGIPPDAGAAGAGFRAYRMVIPRKVFDDAGDEPVLRSDGWSADAELLRAFLPEARRVACGEAPRDYARRQRPSRFAWREGLRQVRGALAGASTPGAYPLVPPGPDVAAEASAPRRSRRRPRDSERGGNGRRSGRTSARSGKGRREPSGSGSGTSKRRRKRRRRGGSGRRSPGADSS
ncbi:MAG TPA: glycosyltransferase family 2 protein [Longimicrobiales bacterium]|nr:glycosyltransferase family 2 protein [Longimicrobiales bacterium]